MSFRVIDYIQRKSAGMYALCNNWANTLSTEVKTNAKWKDSKDTEDTDSSWKGRTEHARQAIHGGVEVSDNTYTVYVAHGVEYGEYLEEGTKPHVIKAKNKPYLHFKAQDGYWRKVKQVNHPGTKGFHTIENTMLDNKERIVNTVIDYWSD